MAGKTHKTNAMRLLERAGIAYEAVTYDLGETPFSGEAVSALTGIPPEQSFKTLCARGERKGVLVFVVPVAGELDLRAAAAAAGDKRVELLPTAQLLPLTGYERGGVSPVGMKKLYPTVFDETAQLFDRVAISGGAKGIKLLVDPLFIAQYLGASFAPLSRDEKG
ncbi:MAG: aminoacyl-tRNA deacylase [Bacillota bacterium]